MKLMRNLLLIVVSITPAYVSADVQYKYDSLGRLVSANHTHLGLIVEYCYDDAGNRVKEVVSTQGGACPTASYSALDNKKQSADLLLADNFKSEDSASVQLTQDQLAILRKKTQVMLREPLIPTGKLYPQQGRKKPNP